MLNAATHSFLLIYAGLFPIVDPIGSVPLFLVLTRQLSRADRRKLSLRVAVNSFFLLLGALFIGSHVLEFFGITLPVVRIGGGLVVMAFGWKLLNDDNATYVTGKDAADTGKAAKPTDAFYPLTMPLTVGPGSISVAITLGSQRPDAHDDITRLALTAAGAAGGLLAMGVTIWVCYRFADRIVGALGASGTNVMIRLSAFILLCIGIQILWTGYSTLTVIHP